MIVHLFGSTTPAGNAFVKLLKDNGYKDVYQYSRNSNYKNKIYLDMERPEEFASLNLKKSSIIISFAPIWITSEFILGIMKFNPNFIKYIKKIIVCSSSSVLTKRFAFNKFDKELFSKLRDAEKIIIDLCTSSNIKCMVVKPTLVYGSFGNYKDKNFSKIINLMRWLPFIILPKNSGLRQPISCRQLANVFFNLINNEKIFDSLKSSSLFVGGDRIIDYNKMLFLIKNSTKKNDLARKCIFIKIPDYLFIFLTFPLSLFSLKFYESVLRIFANLSNFTPQSEITKKKFSKFPDKFLS